MFNFKDVVPAASPNFAYSVFKDLCASKGSLRRLGVVVSELQVILNEIGDSYMEDSGVGVVSTEVV